MALLNSPFTWPLGALPVLRTSGRFALEDRQFATRYFGTSHALHVHQYDAEMRLGDTTLTLRPGDVTISPAGVATAYHLPRAGFHWCVHFMPASEPAKSSARRHGSVQLDDEGPDPAREARASAAASFLPARPDHDPSRPPLAPAPAASLRLHLPLGSLGEHAGQRIMAIAQLRTGGTDPVANAAASAAMLELLLWLSMQARIVRSTSAARGPGAAERAAAILHARLADEICVADLAEEVGLTQNYLARQFRQRYGTTMPHFLLTCRMDHARHLLRHTTLPVARVAAHVGLPDPQHFNKQFRRLVGVSPSQYREGPPHIR
jgi:AraC-like DNA-binding protein